MSKRGRKNFSPLQAVAHFGHAVLADFNSVRFYGEKYHQRKVPLWRLPVDLVTKIGFQTAAATRLMQLFVDLRLPLLPQATSRMIRLVYNTEIHWEADIDPGLMIVHGTGLIISHAARVGAGCILFQNVTLGESTDAKSRQVGAPTLERNVHVGPGSTLLGPITVGEGSKIMAGSVLAVSVPPYSLVRPAESVVVARKAPPPPAEEAK